MKADIHPDYVLAHCDVLVRQRVLDALDEGRAPRGDLRRVPPVLYGEAEARRHRRSGGALPAPPREGRRAPAAPTTSRPWPSATAAGRSRGRDDAKPVVLGRRPCARPRGRSRRSCRTSRRRCSVDELWRLPVDPRRRRARRVARDRLRRLAISANVGVAGNATRTGENPDAMRRVRSSSRS
jgi:hypothetical protein